VYSIYTYNFKVQIKNDLAILEMSLLILQIKTDSRNYLKFMTDIRVFNFL